MKLQRPRTSPTLATSLASHTANIGPLSSGEKAFYHFGPRVAKLSVSCSVPITGLWVDLEPIQISDGLFVQIRKEVIS